MVSSMQYLIAIFKNDDDKSIFYSVASSESKFFSNQLIMENEDVVEEIEIKEFQPNDRQDQGVLFYLDLNKDENKNIGNEIISELQNSNDKTVNTSDLSTLPSNKKLGDEISKIKYLAVRQDGYMLFQCFYKRNVIGERIFSLKSRQMLDANEFITLHEKSDLIYDISENKIYFEKLSFAKRIVNGLSFLQREASAPETQKFLLTHDLAVSPKLSPQKVSLPNKKRIVEVMQNQSAQKKIILEEKKDIDYNVFHQEDLEKCKSDLESFYPGMVKDGKVVINSNQDLEHFLHALDERLYTTSRSHEQRIATAVRKK